MAKKLIEWSQIYSVGYEDIDIQHNKLIDLINEMFNAFSEGKAEEKINDIIEELISYTQYHFDLEEKYFYKHNYPETDEHVNEHQKFVASIIKFKEDIKNKKENVHYEIFEYIKKWLVDHILVADMKYSTFFKGLKINEL